MAARRPPGDEDDEAAQLARALALSLQQDGAEARNDVDEEQDPELIAAIAASLAGPRGRGAKVSDAVLKQDGALADGPALTAAFSAAQRKSQDTARMVAGKHEATQALRGAFIDSMLEARNPVALQAAKEAFVKEFILEKTGILRETGILKKEEELAGVKLIKTQREADAAWEKKQADAAKPRPKLQ